MCSSSINRAVPGNFILYLINPYLSIPNLHQNVTLSSFQTFKYFLILWLRFQVLYEKPTEYVAQFKFTVLLMPNGPHKITGIPFELESFKSDCVVDDQELKVSLSFQRSFYFIDNLSDQPQSPESGTVLLFFLLKFIIVGRNCDKLIFTSNSRDSFFQPNALCVKGSPMIKRKLSSCRNFGQNKYWIKCFPDALEFLGESEVSEKEEKEGGKSGWGSYDGSGREGLTQESIIL